MPQEQSYDEAAAAAVADPEATAASTDAGTVDQPATDSDGAAAGAWDGSQFKMKFRDKEIVPPTREQLVNWAQQGYGYSQRAAELNTREAALKQMEEKTGQYQKLAEAFDANPGFKAQIMKLYQDTVSGLGAAQKAGDQPAIDANGDLLKQIQPLIQQAVAPFQQKAQQFDEFQSQMANKAADESLAKEQQSLQSKYDKHDWTTEDEGGHTLMWRILKMAMDKGLTELEDAYKLYMFGSVAENSKADALRGEAKRIEEEKRRGVVSNGHVIPRSADGPDISGNWNQIAEAALREWKD